MNKFAFKQYSVSLPNWSRAYKRIAFPFQIVRDVKNSCAVNVINPLILDASMLDESRIVISPYQAAIKGSDDYVTNEIHAFVLDNQSYLDSEIDYYSFGSMNTKQEMTIRAEFQLEYYKFAIVFTVHSSGHAAGGFIHMLDTIESDIERIAQLNDIDEHGIVYDASDGSYRLIVLNEKLMQETIEIFSLEELTDNLIGIQLIGFSQTHLEEYEI